MASAGWEDERLLVVQRGAGHLQGAADAEGGDAGRHVLAAAAAGAAAAVVAVDFAVRAVPCHIPVATLLHFQFLHAKEGT